MDVQSLASAELLPVATRTTSTNGTGIDTLAYRGRLKVILMCAASGTGTLDGKIQESDTQGGTYTDIPGATFTQITTAASFQAIGIEPSKRWIRWSDTAASTPSHIYGACVVADKQYRP